MFESPPSLQTSGAVLMLGVIANLFATHRIQRVKAWGRDAGLSRIRASDLVDMKVWPLRIGLYVAYGVLLVVAYPRWRAGDDWSLFAVAVVLALASAAYVALVELRLQAARRDITASAPQDESTLERLRRQKALLAKKLRK